jgi:membrane-associated protease RseP (regulator of RpoE activity)
MKLPLHVALLVLTFVTTTLAGVQWLNIDPFELGNISRGLPFSLCVCSILLAHEMGHYVAARIHHVDTTLPFFIPFPGFLLDGLLSFGTMGAVIRIRSHIDSRKILFDIGAAGPIAGFVVSLAILIAGYLTLPSIDYLYSIHPEYARMDHLPTGGLTFGTPLLFLLLQKIVPASTAFVPPMNEIYHYPLLCSGWFGMFLTSMNLLPVGQLDGGHIAKAVMGQAARKLEIVVFSLLLVLGLAGVVSLFGENLHFGWPGWLLWAAILLYLMIRSRQVAAPADRSLGAGTFRYQITLLCALILILSFSLSPFSLD